MGRAPSVGLVVVSHSRALAEAAVVLAQEMVHGEPLRIEVAAGLPDGQLGTDAVQIAEAIQAADAGSGVVVLMDLGSAVISAEMALEFLDDDEARAGVVLCPAPFVEGLVVAAVSAAAGAARDEVASEAAASLNGKLSHLAPAAPAGPGGSDHSAASGGPGAPDGPGGPGASDGPTPRAGSASATFVVTNAHGLHARPAARLVQEVRALGADVTLLNLTTGAGPVDGASLSSVSTLGARSGHEVQVTVVGPGADDALDQLVMLAGRGFDEPDRAEAPAAPSRAGGAPAAPATSTATPGQAAAPGFGVGPARPVPAAATPTIPDEAATDPTAERDRLNAALSAVGRDVAETRARVAGELGEAIAAIFDAHLQFLDDPALLRGARSGMDSGRSAPGAWAAAVSGIEAQFVALTDPYLRARAADVRAVGDDVLRALLGAKPRDVPGDGVLLADDLSPGEVAALDPVAIRGVAAAEGSPVAHNAILARAKGIPMVVALGPSILRTPAGTTVAVDGTTGEVAVDPDRATLARLRGAGTLE